MIYEHSRSAASLPLTLAKSRSPVSLMICLYTRLYTRFLVGVNARFFFFS